MNFKILENAEVIRLSVDRENGAQSFVEFHEKIVEMVKTSAQDIEVDLGSIDFIDSTGISQLIMLYKLQKQKAKSMRILNATPMVTSLLNLSSLAEVIS
ncbi:MAG: anti-sigma factor antagonist [Spirochaetes bacterium]|nr:MAG: anti-sigma factor antagonist [Spirochaetota bacterium]